MSQFGNLGTVYVPEGETRRLTVVGVRESNDEQGPLAFVDGSALYLLCRMKEMETNDPVVLKQFGADRLLLAGLHPDVLDPGQEVEIRRYEGGGYDVELDPDDIDGLEDAM